ncbi:MAG: prepilin peptidase [Lachnospiraceae bacterium]|nr:prepilin peptidase [Lachnospiraceae bacterium]
MIETVIYISAFLFGIVIGSFLNVCIFRIPKGEDLAKRRSHCMSCGYQLRWFDLIPLFSWIILRGRCRKCHEKISIQYPIIEALNGILYVVVFLVCGICVESVIYCVAISALLALSVIDFRTYIIPIGFNIFILVFGAVLLLYRLTVKGMEIRSAVPYIIGMFAVSVPLGILWFLSKGKAIGGGDVKLMGAAGLLVGWKLIIAALVLGCILGSIIHITRMKISKAGRVLAMGPYLAAGITIVILFGEKLLNWYTGLIGL